MDESQEDVPILSEESLSEDVFIPPSINKQSIWSGESYTHYSPIPTLIQADPATECVLGVDEAGRGPVLGPMVYALFYLPIPQHHSLLATTHHFDDSKVLTPAVRSELMRNLCTAESDLHRSCGWATRAISARDISAGMLKPSGGNYNLNAQAMDATIDLIQGVLDRGVNVKEIYIDTIGNPATYQSKLARIFPTAAITVAKKADSLYPCVSAASVCAKVTRDAALEICYESYGTKTDSNILDDASTPAPGWGSGYPSDARCSTWLKQNMDPLFGWGNECRFSWGTVKDMLETKGAPARIDWPMDEDEGDSMKVTQFFDEAQSQQASQNPLSTWFGVRVSEELF